MFTVNATYTISCKAPRTLRGLIAISLHRLALKFGLEVEVESIEAASPQHLPPSVREHITAVPINPFGPLHGPHKH